MDISGTDIALMFARKLAGSPGQRKRNLKAEIAAERVQATKATMQQVGTNIKTQDMREASRIRMLKRHAAKRDRASKSSSIQQPKYDPKFRTIVFTAEAYRQAEAALGGIEDGK